MSERSQLTPLHVAVIEDDVKTVARLTQKRQWNEAKDRLGFTPLEIAQFLGREDCQKLLGSTGSRSIKVQFKDRIETEILSLETFENVFCVIYRPFLKFTSYKQLKDVIANCPYVLKYSWIARENHSWAKQYREALASGTIVPMSIKWIDDVFGYGAFADADIPCGAFIGEYTGAIRRLSRVHPDHNAYCFRYPTRFWSFNYYIIDALHEGNLLRFVNHSDRPNLQPICVVDRGLLRQVLIANQAIPQGTQLTFDYGTDYWLKRKKKCPK